MLRRDIRRANGSAVWGWRRVGIRESSYLTALVHKRGKSIVTLTQRSQISQQSVLPEKCAALARKAEVAEGIRYIVLHKPDNLVAIIDSERQAVESPQRTEIDSHTVFPENGMRLRESLQRIGFPVLCRSHNVAASVDGIGEAVEAAGKRPQVGQYPALPLKCWIDESLAAKKWVPIADARIGRGSIGAANDYALIVKYRRNDPATVEAAIGAAEGSQVDELVVMVLLRGQANWGSEQDNTYSEHQCSGLHGFTPLHADLRSRGAD